MPADNFLYFSAAAVGGLLSDKATQPKGESTDAWFSEKGALEIKSFSFNVEQKETTGSGSTGAGAGRATFGAFNVTKGVDKASPLLYNACAAGAHYPELLLLIRKPGGSNLLYLQFVFRMVFVTSIEWSGGGGDEAPEEKIVFKYGAMGIQYQQQDATGQPLPTGKSQALWSTATNKNELVVPGLTLPKEPGFWKPLQ